MADLDPSFLNQAKEHLTQIAYPVQSACDEASLQAALSSLIGPPDVVLIDVRLAGKDAPGFVRKTREKYPTLDLVVATGYLHLETAVAVVEAGAFDMVQKPPIWKRVLRTIDIVTERRALLNELPASFSKPTSTPAETGRSFGSSLDVAMAGHEFLSGMIPSFGYMDLLLSGKLGELTAEQRDAMGVVHQGLEWARKRIHSYATTASSDPSLLPLHPENVEITELVEWASEMFRPLAYSIGVEITFQAPPPCTLFIDRDRLLLIVCSLIHNAVLYTRSGGEVVLKIQEEQSQVVLTVSDNGVGIPEEFQEKVFDPFFKVPGATRPTSEGPGLGLACCRLNAILLEATLTLRSTVGSGTTFRLELPRASSSA